MTLLFYEGFDALAGANDSRVQSQLSGKGFSSQPSAMSFSTGRFGAGKAILFSTAAQLLSWTATASTGILGVALKTNSSTGAGAFLRFRDSATIQVGIELDANHRIRVVTGPTPTVLGTGTTVLIPGIWYSVEAKATIANSGSVEVRLNGVLEISLTSVDTSSSANQSFSNLDLFVGDGTVTFDDFYGLTSAGSAPFNDFLNDARVQSLFPTGAGSSTQWTPLSGSNWQNVDDAGLDEDTTYNSTSTTGLIDLFALQDLSALTATVYSAQTACDIARPTDAVVPRARTKLKSGATTSNGTTKTLVAGYQVMIDRYDTNPNGSIAWTVSALNACECGYESLA